MTLLTAETERPEVAFKRKGSGPNYVLLHGGMGSWNHWARNIDALAEHYTVYAIDQPGYGDSPDVDKEMSGDEYRSLVCRAIDTMLGDDASFHLTGFSFGSVLSSCIAARFGARVKALSLIGSSGYGRPEGRDIGTRSYKSAGEDEAVFREIVRNNLLAFMLTNPDSIDETAIDYHGANVRRTRFDSRKVSWGDTQRIDLPRIACPLQIIWGTNDITAHPSLDERIALVRSFKPDFRLDLIEGGSHWTMYDSADAVNRLLLDFHKKVEG
ncbi:MAG: alpha/beta hydrolase [Alphaproteobacteria bacterium]